MKILLIAMSGIGDTLIATPLIHELRANYPDARIDVLVMWAGAGNLLEGNPHISRVWQKNMIKEGAVKTLPFLMKLRTEKYDVSLNAHTQGRVHYRIVAKIIGAKLRLSHSYENASWIDKLLVHQAIPQDYAVHSIENNNRLLALMGAKPVLARHDMEVYLGADEQQWASEYISNNPAMSGPVLGAHVGSGGTKNLALKRWPLSHWIDLLKELSATRKDVAVLLFGGPEERHAHAEIRAALPDAKIFTPETPNLRYAAALMKHCHAFLSVDTALMHLAAAMKVRNQLVIEAPTLNPTNLPFGNPYRIIRNPALNGRSLEYYRYDGGPIKGTDEELIALMASVKVRDVLAAVVEALPQ